MDYVTFSKDYVTNLKVQGIETRYSYAYKKDHKGDISFFFIHRKDCERGI
jgi:hypothetical protein